MLRIPFRLPRVDAAAGREEPGAHFKFSLCLFTLATLAAGSGCNSPELNNPDETSSIRELTSASGAGINGINGANGATGATGASGIVEDASGNIKAGTSVLGSIASNAIYNIGIGYKALTINDEGGGNVGIGLYALSNNVDSSGNVAVGDGSQQRMRLSALGSPNTSVGRDSLQGSETVGDNTGYLNSAFGAWSLMALTSGSKNTAVGVWSLNGVTSGTGNTAIGYQSGTSLSTGSRNTFVGDGANTTSATASYQTAIGAGASVSVDNSVVIGRSADTVYVPTHLRIPTMTSEPTGIYVCKTSEGELTWGTSCTPSDIRLKKNITPTWNHLDRLTQLTPVNWNWIDPSRGDKVELGLIAQDVQKQFPEAVDLNGSGFYNLRYEVLVAPVIGAIKELAGKIGTLFDRTDDHARSIASLKAENEELRAELNALKSALSVVQQLQARPLEKKKSK